MRPPDLESLMPPLKIFNSTFRDPLEASEADAAFRWWELLFLTALIAAILWLNAQWHSCNRAPLPEHSGREIRDSVFVWHYLRETGTLQADRYPPLTYLISALMYQIMGPCLKAALATNAVFITLFLAGMWWLGRELGGRTGGMLLSLAAAGTPWMAVFARGYYVDTSATALLALSFAALVATRGFRRPIPVLLLGLALALGMLAKWSFLFFITVPLCIAWIVLFREGGYSRIQALMVLAALLACGTCFYLMAAHIKLSVQTRTPTFPWRSLTILYIPWLFLSGVAIYFRHLNAKSGEWSPGSGFATAVALGAGGCLWWYLYSLFEIRDKGLRDFIQNTPPGQAYNIMLSTLGGTYWLAPVLLLLGVLAFLYFKSLRLPALMALSAPVAAVLTYPLLRAPISPRHLLPGIVFSLALCFGWQGRVRYLGRILCVLMALISFLQVGWWLVAPQGRSGIAQDVGVVTDASWIQPGWWLRIPRAHPPDPTYYPLEETLKPLLENKQRRVTSIVLPGASFAPDELLMLAAFKGKELDGDDYWAGKPGGPPGNRFVLIAAPLSVPREALFSSYPWLRPYDQVGTWEASAQDHWFLFREKK